MRLFFLAASGICLMLACQPVPSGHSHGSHDHGSMEGHSHEEEAVLSFTRYTDEVELFVEFRPLVVGQISRFAAHFTTLVDYKPIREGSVTVSLVIGSKGVRQAIDSPSSPGIFNLALQPNSSGVGQLIFDLQNDLLSEQIILEDIQVFETETAASSAIATQSSSADNIEFLKEQAWKIDFAIEQIHRQTIHEIIQSSGEIQPVKGEEKIVPARSTGLVFFRNVNLLEGREVRQGEILLTINSRGLVQANMEEKYQIAKARLENTKANFERAEDLLSKQIIGQKEHDNRKMAYSIAEAEYQTLTSSYSASGQSVVSPMTGLIKNIMVSDGEFVEEGTPLLKITNNRRLLLRAEVSQKHLPTLSQIKTANFQAPYQTEMQSLNDYNGRLVTFGKVIEPGSNFIPILFELDNLRDLIPGSYVELFLIANPVEQSLVIPRSALMQDFDLHYVYVQTGGESFEKRPVNLGVDDGFNVQVISGLQEGEWVVTQGAYQVKMASMSSSIPAHGHTH